MLPSTSRGGHRPAAGLSVLLVPVRALAFWAAIVLPFLSVALFALGYRLEPPTLGVVLVANVAALLVGHGYHR